MLTLDTSEQRQSLLLVQKYNGLVPRRCQIDHGSTGSSTEAEVGGRKDTEGSCGFSCHEREICKEVAAGSDCVQPGEDDEVDSGAGAGVRLACRRRPHHGQNDAFSTLPRDTSFRTLLENRPRILQFGVSSPVRADWV